MTNNRSSFPAQLPAHHNAPTAQGSARARSLGASPWPAAYDQASRRQAPAGRGVATATREFPSERLASLSAAAVQARPEQQRSTGTVRLVLIVTLAFLAVFAARASKAGADSGPQPVRTVVVREGDTLWTIARTVQPEGDVRPLVSKIARTNNLRGVLHSGTTLVLPS